MKKKLNFSKDSNQLQELFLQMIEIAFVLLSNEFIKKFRKKIDVFKEDPFDYRLRTHKLSGKLKDPDRRSK